MEPIVCLKQVDPPACARVGLAMLVVNQKFLSDLEITPAPRQFVRGQDFSASSTDGNRPPESDG